LKITVTQDRYALNNEQTQSVSGNIQSGDARVTNRASAQNKSITISGTKGEGNSINYSFSNNRSNIDDKNTFTIQALEGEPAFIQSGVSVPISNPSTIITQNGVVVQNSVEYRDATSGFYVLPRINGNRVSLMVAPQTSSVNPGQIPTFNIQNVNTTVTGQLGEWIEIGTLTQSSQGNNQSTLSNRNNQTQESRTILTKVEEIR
jgi:type II secretory pathway component GspD/PulD (secretin)